ncbi:hypothetical protein DM02DRAFT_63346 [Periconia macrospinosa]|uniref:Uncharacterized protein n=1 Tax=Periconia macrospinosa TaxID=97972 RepID=A0A2V1DI90_9PLEO|nr:hypothetical protein DM02DRAFT_63346 [Periconia macrospinosa]
MPDARCSPSGLGDRHDPLMMLACIGHLFGHHHGFGFDWLGTIDEVKNKNRDQEKAMGNAQITLVWNTDRLGWLTDVEGTWSGGGPTYPHHGVALQLLCTGRLARFEEQTTEPSKASFFLILFVLSRATMTGLEANLVGFFFWGGVGTRAQ